ncbi:MAG: DUF4157 domain-containing protein [Tabrizicola sp.]|jgi:hypothetical protein|nr:DUF4157 domain-containing protein [Tabrizicola sp.]
MRALVLVVALTSPALAEGPGLPFERTGRAVIETSLDIAAASLANVLVLSRDAAWAEGTRPMPSHIRQALLEWYPAELLDSIEYRTGIAENSTLQALAIRHGDAVAITLIDTIVFADPHDVETNIPLWAHEVKHVEQFRRWGLMGFARAYVRDHQAVEAEAYAIGDTVRATLGGG